MRAYFRSDGSAFYRTYCCAEHSSVKHGSVGGSVSSAFPGTQCRPIAGANGSTEYVAHSVAYAVSNALADGGTFRGAYGGSIYVGPDKCAVDVNADERADTRPVPYCSSNQCSLTTSGHRAGRGAIQRPRR